MPTISCVPALPAIRPRVKAGLLGGTCGWFGFDRPKSSLTQHFKALREAGLIRQRQYHLERRSRVRAKDLDARFSGLLNLVKAWEPAAISR
ncbi:hypothetical protein [Agrobacterium pusense]|uniref:hypothetical protein n=1 Tax=Agrobacterium pusense TaxID=648995 RepID=UPI002899122D|nr:hypothetical protein [Agrobacterium pusense]